MAEGKIMVSVEKAVYNAIEELIKNARDQHGIIIEEINTD